MTSLVNSTKCLKHKYKLFTNSSKIEERIAPNSFCKTSITLISKADKDITRKQWANIAYEYGHKNSQENSSKQNPTTSKKDYIT